MGVRAKVGQVASVGIWTKALEAGGSPAIIYHSALGCCPLGFSFSATDLRSIAMKPASLCDAL